MGNFLQINASAMFERMPLELDRVPEDSQVRFILTAVGSLDLRRFDEDYGRHGSPV
jgi:hypothetical protein